MPIKDYLIIFLNAHVKEYETNLLVSEAEGFKPISKKENTVIIVDDLLEIVEDYFEDDFYEMWKY